MTKLKKLKAHPGAQFRALHIPTYPYTHMPNATEKKKGGEIRLAGLIIAPAKGGIVIAPKVKKN